MLHFFARRLNELHKEDRKGEKGFTLIELLVVVIIIGILAAIAIPVFLAQRDKAQNAAAESDLRNMTASATAFASDNNGSYASLPTGQVTSTHILVTKYDFHPTDGVKTYIDTATANGYTAHSVSVNGTTYKFDTSSGQVTLSP